MSRPVRIAIIGYGKIAEDQHVPAIAGTPGFELAATVSRRRAGPAGFPAFASIAELVGSGIAVDAAALCNTPEDRPATAFEAIAAGWHVLMEKPPAAALSTAAVIETAAAAAGVTLFASWHSRFAPAVDRARALLAGRQVTGLAIEWREDVRKWHPGQAWIWQPGGFGVFDPGINALSIATAILPVELCLDAALLEIPEGRQTPIAAELRFGGPGVPADARAVFDWRATGTECWTVRVAMDGARDGDVLELTGGGSALSLNGLALPTEGPGEYPALYHRFGDLVATGRSEVDVRPLRLAADAFLLGERRTVARFDN